MPRVKYSRSLTKINDNLKAFNRDYVEKRYLDNEDDGLDGDICGCHALRTNINHAASLRADRKYRKYAWFRNKRSGSQGVFGMHM